MPDDTAITTKGEPGRPTVMTEDVVAKLETVFKLGVTDDIACDYAEIDPTTYYRRMKSDEVFARKMRAAKNFSRIAAGQVVMKSIVGEPAKVIEYIDPLTFEKKKKVVPPTDPDVKAAMWWLEKKYPREFSSNPQLTQINVGVKLPDWYKKPNHHAVEAEPKTE